MCKVEGWKSTRTSGRSQCHNMATFSRTKVSTIARERMTSLLQVLPYLESTEHDPFISIRTSFPTTAGKQVLNSWDGNPSNTDFFWEREASDTTQVAQFCTGPYEAYVKGTGSGSMHTPRFSWRPWFFLHNEHIHDVTWQLCLSNQWHMMC